MAVKISGTLVFLNVLLTLAFVSPSLVRPTAVTTCSNVEVNEGDEIRCLCEGKHRNPPASVSWIKDDATVAGPSSLEIVLVKKINRSDGGTYVCKAWSHDLEAETSFIVAVNFLYKVKFFSNQKDNIVVPGSSVTLTYDAIGRPEPNYVILRHGCEVIGRNKSYAIRSAKCKDAGAYQNIASNYLGNASASLVLSLMHETRSLTKTTPTSCLTDITGGGNKTGNISPPSRTTFHFTNGSNGEISWTYTFSTSQLALRTWYFNSGAGSEEQLASIVADRNAEIKNSSLPRISVRKPGTLVLQNVDIKFNGIYRFEVQWRSRNKFTSELNVIVVVGPTAVTNCSNVEVNDGDEMRCVCEGKHGNPPASISWIKDGVTVPGPVILQILLVKTVGSVVKSIYAKPLVVSVRMKLQC